MTTQTEVCGGSVSPNPYLAPDSICSSCCKTRGRRQLIKVGVVTQSYLRALSVSIRDSLIKQVVTRGRQLTKVVLQASSLGTLDPVPHSRPWDESTVSRLSFPDSGDHT